MFNPSNNNFKLNIFNTLFYHNFFHIQYLYLLQFYWNELFIKSKKKKINWKW